MDKVKNLPTIEKCDHSPILLQINFLNENDNGKGYWKFNNSLLQNNDFCLKIEQTIESVINENHGSDDQIRWELIKFEVRSVAIRF